MVVVVLGSVGRWWWQWFWDLGLIVVVVVVVLGYGFDDRFMGLLEIGLFIGFMGLICCRFGLSSWVAGFDLGVLDLLGLSS